MNADVMEALQRAKKDKAYYLWLVRNKLNITPKVASDLYRLGAIPASFPLPAIRAMVNNAQRLIQFGEITAENGFDLPTVFERYVKLR